MATVAGWLGERGSCSLSRDRPCAIALAHRSRSPAGRASQGYVTALTTTAVASAGGKKTSVLAHVANAPAQPMAEYARSITVGLSSRKNLRASLSMWRLSRAPGEFCTFPGWSLEPHQSLAHRTHLPRSWSKACLRQTGSVSLPTILAARMVPEHVVRAQFRGRSSRAPVFLRHDGDTSWASRRSWVLNGPRRPLFVDDVATVWPVAIPWTPRRHAPGVPLLSYVRSAPVRSAPGWAAA